MNIVRVFLRNMQGEEAGWRVGGPRYGNGGGGEVLLCNKSLVGDGDVDGCGAGQKPK